MAVDNRTNSWNNPAWWNETYDSGWDRLKAAVQRDWEQTKAHFSGGKSGAELNQDAGDTLGQAAGKKPIPPVNVPNPMDADDIERESRKAEQRAEKEWKRIEKERDALARDNRPWNDIEAPLRYGYGAGAFHSNDWDDATEARLREEWRTLYPDRDWTHDRDPVRVGWERSRG